MSDFDKEAEREKLREKYERDEEKRQTTEQMSELLLQGATMTNAHCDDCGDPIFRYDGQEFCPSCQKPVDRDQGEEASTADQAAEDGDAAAAEGGDTDNIEVRKPSDDATVRFGSGQRDSPPAGEETESDAADAPTSAEANGDAPSPDETEGVGHRETVSGEPVGVSARSVDDGDQTRSAPSVDPADAGRQTPPVSSGTDAAGAASDHLREAQVTLAQTVERFAERARAADSPREAKDHLEAAREAAAALEATQF